MIDQYRLALGHLQAAMAAMTQCRDTLAVATIAQAISVVDRGATIEDGGTAADLPVANRRPC